MKINSLMIRSTNNFFFFKLEFQLGYTFMAQYFRAFLRCGRKGIQTIYVLFSSKKKLFKFFKNKIKQLVISLILGPFLMDSLGAFKPRL